MITFKNIMLLMREKDVHIYSIYNNKCMKQVTLSYKLTKVLLSQKLILIAIRITF